MSVYMAYLDLDELPTLFAGRLFWSFERANLMSFRSRDYLGAAPNVNGLAAAVREHVREHLGFSPDGAIRVLTNLRSFGFVFNPVTFYYCFDASGELCAVVSQITNTPWGERHVYVTDARTRTATGYARSEFQKAFHVSPFMPMDQRYDWTFGTPGPAVLVHMRNLDAGREVFDATLSLRHHPLTSRVLAGTLIRYPVFSLLVLAAIYLHAGILWLKRVPHYIHPRAAGEHKGPPKGPRGVPDVVDHVS
jgi:DUF1365 family protein